MILAGERYKEIAKELGLHQKTITTYRRLIWDKLGVNSVAQLVRLAIREGALPDQPSLILAPGVYLLTKPIEFGVLENTKIDGILMDFTQETRDYLLQRRQA